MSKQILVLTAFLLVCSTASAWALSYNYLSAEQLHAKITANAPLTLLDIQYEGAYKAGHFPQATVTYAYPVKTAASRAQIDAKLSEFQPEGAIVVLSRRGGGGAMRTFDHLKRQGIDAARLFILKSGMKAWPYKELIEVTKD